MAHISNAWIIRVSKLVKSIDLGYTKKYNLIEVFIDLEDSNNSRANFQVDPTPIQQSILKKIIDSGSIRQIKADINNNDALDKLCTLCIGSKSTQIVQKNMSMTLITDKLEEVYADLWGLHNPLFQSGSTYTAILICKYTWKTWTLYLQGKNDFIDLFQAWLSQVEAESKYSIKI